MNAILFTKVGGRSLVVTLTRARCYVPFALGFLLLCGALLQAGYQAGKSVVPRATDSATVSEQGLAQAQINTLAQRMGQMRAQVQRLEALGQRLSQVAGINPDDFNLDAAPAVGGQQVRIAAAAPNLSVMQQAVSQLSQFIDLRERRLTVLDHLLASRGFTEPHFTFGEPATQAFISSGFGERSDPFTGLTEFHSGLDFAGRAGSPVVAAADGVVSWVGTREGYGHMVEIDHSNGLVTRYGHTQRYLVHSGEVVSKGQTIALMGSTGRSTGPHVHFEVLQGGVAVDPAQYLPVLAAKK
jgi:murein DD-endopeptidase MepM/ murein hydrolase activator NlpD